MRQQYEIADVIRQFYDDDFRKGIPVYQQRTLKALLQCRTAALGGHIDVCDGCGLLQISYNSCRNRNCPKCQGLEKESWTIQREEELLPVPYFHVVFTLPHELNGLCLHNPRFMYDLLFDSAWYVLQTFANDPKWLGAQTAATMVLHTWGQNLQLHPHVHCIVPGGGLDKEGHWQNPRKGGPDFLFPALAMNKVYRAYFLKQLKIALESGQLSLPDDFPKRKGYKLWKEQLYKKEWVVYTKPPFSKPENVVNYLARYSHRIAIYNQRIINVTNEAVTFRYKDYRDGSKQKTMVLQGREFLRRFCLHIVPDRFRKIRHYGFLSNAVKIKYLKLAKMDLEKKRFIALSREERRAYAKLRLFGFPDDTCHCCGQGKMVAFDSWSANKDPPDYLNVANGI